MRDSAGPGFELDRVVADDGKVRVVGWWHGVRGRRFIRPSLTAIGAGPRARVLAELEHKPWSAENGERWLAEFSWEHPLDDVEAFELAVAPDLAVRIPPPGPTSKLRTARARQAEERAQKRPARESKQNVLPVASPTRPRPQRGGADVDPLRILLAEQERARAVAATAEAMAERDRAIEAREQAHVERDRLLKERDLAVSRAAEADAARKRAAVERQHAADERDQALRERDEARRLHASARADRDALARELHASRAERDQLIAARNQAREERNAILAQHARMRHELEGLRRERPSLPRQAADASADELLRAQAALTAELEQARRRAARYERERDEAVGRLAAQSVPPPVAGERRLGQSMLARLAALIAVLGVLATVITIVLSH